MRALLRSIPGLFALAALPAMAQIVVVPLEPSDPNEIFPQDPNSGVILPDPETGLYPTEPVTGFEPLPPADPNEGWAPLPDALDPNTLAPLDPNMVAPGGPLGDDNMIGLVPLPPGSVVGEDVTTVEEDPVTTGTGARLKGLDKLAGTVTEMTVQSGETVGLGWLQITLGECRYPIDNPSGEAFAWLVIREAAGEAPVFEGWMIASSPGLNALDHARFDVWVLSCTTPQATAEAPEPGDG